MRRASITWPSNANSREDVDRFHGFLLEIGATILDPPAEYAYTPGYYAVFFADPDGIKLEVVFSPSCAAAPADDDGLGSARISERSGLGQQRAREVDVLDRKT